MRWKMLLRNLKGVLFMTFEIFSWILAFVSLTGNFFVNKKNVLGQWIWAVSNVGWVTYNISIGSYAQAFLFSAYLGMCVWGIITWTKKQPQPCSE